MSNSAIRFSLESSAIRGSYVSLTSEAATLLEVASYPDSVAKLLLEFTGAVAAVSNLSQFEGTMTLQGRSDKGLNVIMAEKRANGEFRGIARGHETVTGESYNQLLEDGILALTLDPKVGQRYQGLIAIEGNSLAEGLADYFEQSEQLRTFIQLFPRADGVAAMILQAMPDTEHSQVSDDDWETACSLANTLSTEETEQLDAEAILYRLFHEGGVRVYDTEALRYHCGCSKQRMAAALKTLNEAELREFVETDGKLELNCEFCNSSYDFFAEDLDKIFHIVEKSTDSQSVKKLH